MGLPYQIATLLYAFNERGDVLLLERAQEPNRGLWSPCGGKLRTETGESPYACACREAAEELGLEFLGEIPLDPATREASDAGMPVTQAAPESAASMAFMAVAEKIAARCSVQNFIEETT